MNNERKLTCIVCPRGCDLLVTFDDEGRVSEVSGYACPRGKDYAISECTAPVRTITSTIRCADGSLVSVKTSKPVDKNKIFDVMKAINSAVAENTVKMGDVIIAGVCDTDADVIATSEK